jgi:tRNA-specific 2-thiouridylase
MEGNTVTLGDESDLYSPRLLARDVNFVSIKKLEAPRRVGAKIRYSQTTAEAEISPAENDCVLVSFDRPQRAVTAGQAVVFYDGDIVVGGGTIELI